MDVGERGLPDVVDGVSWPIGPEASDANEMPVSTAGGKESGREAEEGGEKEVGGGAALL